MEKLTKIFTIINTNRRLLIYLFVSNFDRFCFWNRQNYHPHAFLEDCKYSDENSDERNSNEENSNSTDITNMGKVEEGSFKKN